jgi:hypothetical protein
MKPVGLQQRDRQTPATSYTVDSEEQITVIAPPGAAARSRLR